MKWILFLVFSVVLSFTTLNQTAIADDSLGVAKSYNVFLFENFTSTASDTQGKLAAGGNVALDSYGVASTLPNQPEVPTLIVGGDLTYGQGKIFAGSALVAGSIEGVNETVTFGLESGASISGNASIDIDFANASSKLSQLSSDLARVEPTGKVEYKYGGVYLTGDCQGQTQVFSLSGQAVLNSNHITLNCVPSDSTIIFNIDGATAGFKNIGLSQLHNQAPKILYNFYQATSVEFTWVGVEGTVLAPLAHLENPRGQVNGTVIAKSWNGPMELHHFPFVGDLQAALDTLNQAPVALNQDIETPEDVAISFVLQATDEDGDEFDYLVVSQPQSGTVSVLGSTLTYTPNAEFSGEDSLTFLVNDGQAESNIATVSISVVPVNDSPEAQDQTLITDEDIPLNIVLTGTDTDSNVLFFTVQNQTANGTLSGTTPNLIYKPTLGFHGNDSFTFVVNDGALNSSAATVSIRVNPVNSAPVANNQSIGITEDVAVSIELTGTDAEGDTLSYSVQSQPENGVLSGTGSNVIYTPGASFNGSDVFTFIVNDGELDSNAASVSITVSPTNDAPVADSQSLSTDEGIAIPIVLGGSDVDGDALSYAIQTQPVNGALSGVAPNLTYTPDSAFNGVDSLTFIVNDGELNSAVAMVQITVIEEVSELPDLTITEISSQLVITDPQSLETSGDLSFTVVNQGAAAVNRPFVVMAFYDENNNGQYDIEFDAEFGSLNITEEFVINESKEYSVALSGSLPFRDAPIQVFVDSDNLVVESNETNNAANTADMCKLDSRCTLEEVPFGKPKVKWAWTGSSIEPTFNQVISTPVVAQTNDDNNDGLINTLDVPDVIFTTYELRDVIRSSPGLIRIASGVDGSELAVFTELGPIVEARGSLAVADIDGDGEVEILAPAASTGVLAIDLDGSLKWHQPNMEWVRWGGISIADLNADGRPEILAAGSVLDKAGNILWQALETDGQFVRGLPRGSFPIAADVNLDGVQEAIFGGAVYNADGSVLWRSTDAPDGLNAIGNFDADNEPELVVVSAGSVYLIDNDGSLIWRAAVPGGGEGGAPTVADVDGDGEPEIGIASGTRYSVFNANGSVLWQVPVMDTSSRSTGSSVFDFNNDGVAEVVYADERFLHAFNGETGEDIFKEPHSSITTFENPVIVDLDNDGHAEIVVAQNDATMESGFNGIRVFEEESDSWVGTRGIWNQHAYSIDNINDDGSIPLVPRKSWLSHNTFRLNTFPQCANESIQTVYLNKDNISVRLGDGMAAEPFENRSAADSLVSIIDANTALSPEDHNQQTHVWVKGSTLSLRFDLGQEYDLRKLHLWNYFTEEFDVDDIDFQFYDSSNNLVGSLSNVSPALGGSGGNPIFAEEIPLSFPSNIQFVNAVLAGSNGQVDFNNIGFTGRLSSSKLRTDLSISKLQFLQTQGAISARFGNGGSLASAVGTKASVYHISSTGNRVLIGTIDIPVLESGEHVDLEMNNVTGLQNNDQIEVVIDENNDIKECRENNNSLAISVVLVEKIILQGTMRDFQDSHPDFEQGLESRLEPEIVTNALSADRKPEYAGNPTTYSTNGEELFNQWFKDFDGVNISKPLALELDYDPSTGLFVFDSSGFFPIDDELFGNQGRIHNYHFTYEVNNRFTYLGGETFAFRGDDDVWVYINDKLALNLGGTHNPLEQSVNLDEIAVEFGLERGKNYSFDFFYAERQSVESSFRMETRVQLESEPRIAALTQLRVDRDTVILPATANLTQQVTNTGNVPQTLRVELLIEDSNGNLVTQFDDVVLNDFAINETTLLNQEWVPATTMSGNYVVRGNVYDADNNLLSSDSRVLNVKRDSSISLTITPSQPVYYLGDTVMIFVEGTHSLGDSVAYELTSAPAGATINASTGQITWAPTSVGLSTVVLKAFSVDGTENSASLSINIRPIPNQAPVITSTPGFSASVDELYRYGLLVNDGDGDTLTYALVTAPIGMLIDAATGLASWTPSNAQIGSHPVVIRVGDGRGASATQSFTIIVRDVDAVNNPPRFISNPNGNAIFDEVYSYNVNAADIDGDILTYSLLTAPLGMSIDAVSGVIEWTPGNDQTGSHDVSIQVEDGRGGSATQSYGVFVSDGVNPNSLPEITSLPEANAKATFAYSYQVVANDADGDVLSYSVVEGPADLTLDASGLVAWTPTQVGLYTIRIRVSDQKAFVEQIWQINVLSADAVLTGEVSVSPKVVDEAETVTIQVQPVNAIEPVSISMSVDGVIYALDQNNQAQVVASGIGPHEVIAVITDKFDTIQVNESFSVRDPNDSDAPLASFSSLVDGQVITAPVDIVGSIEDPNISTWQLVYLAKGAEPTEFIVLASGTTNVVDQTLAQFDPSLMRNGQYSIVLVATDANAQTTQESISVQVDRDLKVGNFSITFEDLNIPLGGIPISVRRTYDSRDRAQNRDFGFGWSLDYQNVKVEESRTPGFGWSLNEYPTGPLGILTNFCVEPQGAPVVSVTLPDGDVERFEVGASPRCNQVIPIRNVDMTFTSVGDTQTTLEATDGAGFYYQNNNLTQDITLSDVADPNRYRLTTRAGFIYELNQGFGVSKVIDPNGNTLTYSDDGIVHSDGKRVDFARDASGRVTKVTDPMGRSLNYAYDDRGDLTTVTERDLAETDFAYNQSHGLIDIRDPLGRNVVKNIYDDSGRLIAQEDAEGIRTEFSHDLTGRESVVTDRNGNTSFIYYDENGYVTSQVDALGNITAYTHDANGNQLTELNALGHQTTATFSDRNDQLTQTDALGNVTTFAYDQRGKETVITDARGNEFNNSYDSVGNLLTVTDPQGNIAGNNINRHGLPSKTIDVLGNETNYSYDDEGNKLSETDAEGNVVAYTYDDNNNALSQTSTRMVSGTPTQEITTFEYDVRDRVVKTIDALGNVSTTEYDLVGNEVAQVDALGRRTTMQYDSYNRLVLTTYPDGTTTSNSYDPEGNLLNSTDRLGRVTTNAYDALYRLVSVAQADGSVTRTEYDAIGRVTAEVDANLNRTVHAYDAANRRTSTTDALGNVTQFAYDADGNMVQMTDANGNVTSYTYNELDQKVQTTFQNASTMQEGLDALSRKTSMTDQAGVVTNYTYDKLGRLTKVTDALNQETTYSYDSIGNKLTQTDAQGRTTRWAYDALGRVISRTLPLGQVETMVYDAVGNLTQRTDFNGQISTYGYDVNNRMVSAVYEGGLSETYAYDALGNRTQATKTENGVTSSWVYTYDNLNRLSSETQFTGTADEVTLSYEYDAQGNRTQLTETTASETRITRYTFDVLNRLKTVQDPDGNTTTYNYDAVGNRIGMDHQNGIQTSYVYDELNRLTSVEHQNATNVTLKKFDYALLANGKRSKITEANGRTTDYTYDLLYRLTDEAIFDPVNQSHNAAYTYDAVGNRTFEVVNGVSTQYTYNDNDWLVQTGGTLYTYDANGSTLTETLDGNVGNFSYNAKNELISQNKAAVNTVYLYNTDGIRIGQGNSASQTLYTLDNNRSYAQVISEVIDGAQSVNYTYGDDLVSQKRGTLSTYHYDGLGSTRALSDAAGAVTDTYDYDAFGETLNQTGTTENNYLFTGEQFDPNLDQYYLRARYYDQGVGRFTQMDTWMGINSDPVTLHKYLYANVDPVNMVDPTGNFGIGSFGASSNISGILSTTSIAANVVRVGSIASRLVVNSTLALTRNFVMQANRVANAGRKIGNVGGAVSKAVKAFRKFRRSKNFKGKPGLHYIDVWGPTGVSAPNKKIFGKYRRIGRKLNIRKNKQGGGGRVFMLQYKIGLNGNTGKGTAFQFRVDYQDYTTMPSTFRPHYHLCYGNGTSCKDHHYF